jgi:hypothetical protein
VAVEVERKPEPLMVRLWAAAPVVAEAGDRLVMTGTGLLTVKFSEFDAPPPGAGLVSTTAYVPAVAWSLALKVIVSSSGFIKVAVWLTPLYVTVEAATKFVPLMVNTCAAEPAVAAFGDRLPIFGTGFRPVPDMPTVCGLPDALSVNISEALRLPAADGVKVTSTVHVPFAAKLAPVQ